MERGLAMPGIGKTISRWASASVWNDPILIAGNALFLALGALQYFRVLNL